MDRRMDKKVKYIYTVEYYSALKRRNLVICGNKEGPRGYYAKWNKSDKERQIPYNFTYIWNQKKHKQTNKKTTKQKRNRCTDTENKLMVAREDGGGGGHWAK